MNLDRAKFRAGPTLALTLAVGAAVTALVRAGPLNPPLGPVSSTYKTLTEVEPRTAIDSTNTPGDSDSLYKITQPGSYYLTKNIVGEPAKHGIEIAASGVTIDLMGFDLVGEPGGRSFDGITHTVGSLQNITVRNGSVRDWGMAGIDLGSITSYNASVIDVRASSNGGMGIQTSLHATVTGCKAYSNGQDGIKTSYYSSVSGCTTLQNTGNGIIVGRSSVVSDCTSDTNGFSGYNLDAGCTITACSADGNTSDGITASAGCHITSCGIYNNRANGITLNSGGGTISNCTSRVNFGNGISVTNDCLVTANDCTRNGNGTSVGAGIYVSGGNNRIEGNNCTSADYGVQVAVAGNIIVRNTCSSNTTLNWSIAANNVCGPVLNRSAPASAAITGDSGVSSLGTTDPNANFTY
ncbi:MAG: right-handed parallel beta-helix repeat-containing protein [Planctomycetes bacterium]|nr:right-handed parallel beta-helix repeat-containing protein [Planctomycetota bacterium]